MAVTTGPITGTSRPGGLREWVGLKVPVLVLTTCLVATATVPSVLTAHATALWVAAGLLGLPHGALDVLVLVDRRRPALSLVRLAGYAVVAAATIALAVRWPGPAVAVLLVLSVAHFAEGERAYDVLRGGRGDWRPGVAVAVTVLLLPLALHADRVTELLRALGLAVLLEPAARAAAFAVVVGVVAVGLADAVRTRQRREAGEMALVVVASAVCPPLVVFAAWFAGWHSLRHIVRVADRTAVPVPRLLAWAAVPTLVAGAGLLLLLARMGPAPALVLGLLALTVPHAVAVTRLDRA
jgi:Brp/Blh family beta-carotene 15,15'-monooxygenase